MTYLEKYDIPYNDLEQSIMDWVAEALELRHGDAGDPDGKLSNPTLTAGPRPVVAMLRRVSQRADRVDELLAKATQARGRFRRARDEAQFSAEIAYDEATQRNKVRRDREAFESREERKAEAALASLNEKRAEHEARRLVSIAEEAHEIITQVHRQLDSIRQDLRTTLRTLQFEGNLDR